MAREVIYWDANAFSGYLNDEHDKVAACGDVLTQAQAGHILIATSALTLAEVLYIKGGPKLDPSKRTKIEQFFKADYIAVRNVTRAVSNLARDVYWDHGIMPKDAVHVATAMMYKIPVLNTFDEPLIGKNGIAVNGHVLRIGKPHVIVQADWVDDKAQDKRPA